MRDGKPYLVKGVGGTGSMAAPGRGGGNSVRTWGAENLGAILDEAHRHGLTRDGRHLARTRTARLQLQRRRSGRRADRRGARRSSSAIRPPGPAGVGARQRDGRLSEGRQRRHLVGHQQPRHHGHKLDPNHPTMTVVAEIGGDRVKNIHRLCPDIDIVGINSYGGAASLAEALPGCGRRQAVPADGVRTAGHLGSQKERLGRRSGTQQHREGRTLSQDLPGGGGAKGLCLGSYAFLWGTSRRRPRPGSACCCRMATPRGRRRDDRDVDGQAAGQSLSGHPISQGGRADEVDPGSHGEGALAASIRRRPLRCAGFSRARRPFGVGGDNETAPPTLSHGDPEGTSNGGSAAAEEWRRLSAVRVRQRRPGGAAVANVPLRVKGLCWSRRCEWRAAVRGLRRSSAEGRAVCPHGWMGNVKAMKMDPRVRTARRRARHAFASTT